MYLVDMLSQLIMPVESFRAAIMGARIFALHVMCPLVLGKI